MGTAHPNLVPYQAFATSDGNLMLAVGNDRQFRHVWRSSASLSLRLTRVREQCRADRESRAARRDPAGTVADQYHGILAGGFAAGGVPAGPINDIGEVLSNAHARRTRAGAALANAAGDTVPTVSNPVAFEETPVHYERAPPLLGEHTDEVLREWLGYSADRIAALRNDAAI